MKNVFLIGDSIRMNYESVVVKKLSNKALVWECGGEKPGEIGENARFSSYTLNNLAKHMWLCHLPEKIDVVHWNNGIWDTVIRYEEDGAFTLEEEFERNIRRIIRELKKITSNIIAATITPPKIDKVVGQIQGFVVRDNEIVKKYNEIIKKVAKENNIEVNDLYQLAFDNREKYICEDMTHLSEEGKIIFGNQVAEYIKKYL